MNPNIPNNPNNPQLNSMMSPMALAQALGSPVSNAGANAIPFAQKLGQLNQQAMGPMGSMGGPMAAMGAMNPQVNPLGPTGTGRPQSIHPGPFRLGSAMNTAPMASMMAAPMAPMAPMGPMGSMMAPMQRFAEGGMPDASMPPEMDEEEDDGVEVSAALQEKINEIVLGNLDNPEQIAMLLLELLKSHIEETVPEEEREFLHSEPGQHMLAQAVEQIMSKIGQGNQGGMPAEGTEGSVLAGALQNQPTQGPMSGPLSQLGGGR